MVTKTKPLQPKDHTHPHKQTSESAGKLHTKVTIDDSGFTPGYGNKRLDRPLWQPNPQRIKLKERMKKVRTFDT